MNSIRQSDINRIRDLRLNDGKSLREIAKITGFGKATISKYCHDLRENNDCNPSNEAAAKANKNKWLWKKNEIIRKAVDFYNGQRDRKDRHLVFV